MPTLRPISRMAPDDSYLTTVADTFSLLVVNPAAALTSCPSADGLSPAVVT